MARIKTRSIRLLIRVLLLCFGAIPVYAQTAQEIARNAFTSTVLLVMDRDTNGQPLSLGSGFFVRDGEVASNLHVVEGAARGYAKIVGQKSKYAIEGITALDPERGPCGSKDFCCSRIDAFALGSSDAVQVGETVYAVGNPQGLEGTFSQGIVSSIRQVGTDKLLQITAPISPGSSGGPVLSSTRGEVIGVSVATFRGGQNLNFAIPSNYLKALLEKAGSPRPLAQARPTKAQRSILSDLGGKSSEGVIGTQFIWDTQILLGMVAYYHGGYTFSLKNQLRESIKNVYCLVVFYDQNNSPIDVDVIEYKSPIPAGLARRVSGKVDGSVQRLTTRDASVTPSTKVEFRILDFQLLE